MTALHIYGIKNCDTMKKALRWLDDNKIAYIFHDYKKTGADMTVLKAAMAKHGWESVINRKGTSWRALPDAVKNTMTATTALTTAAENPSLIRRPLIVHGPDIYLGFDEEEYAALFKN